MSDAIEVADSTGWRIGVLYSRTGVTSATESEHFFGTALAIEEVNADGGVVGVCWIRSSTIRRAIPMNTAGSPLGCSRKTT